MNNQLSNTKGDHSSTSALTKPQKIPTSVANLHLRTETNTHTQDSRSLQKGGYDERQTNRRPRMPYNKLPDAFNMRQKKKKTNKDVVDNLNRIAKISQYKQLAKILDPIPLESKPQERTKEPSMNPLATIHKYFKMESRFREKMQDHDRSFAKPKAFSTKAPGLKITECITLEILKHRHNTGTLKKILHVPSLKLLTSKEEPLNSKDQRISIKSWLQAWQSSVSPLSSFVSLQGYLFNVPEGAISIVTQYCENGSLENLLDSVFTLPESVIREVFCQVFSSLDQFYKTTEGQTSYFGGLSPSQILFTSQGKVKIGLGIYYQLSISSSSNTIYDLRSQPKKGKFDFVSTQKNFMKQQQSQQTQEIDRSLDVFKIGLMMLECAIGRLENFQQSQIIQDALRSIFTEEGQNLLQSQNVCCLFHSERFLLQNIGQVDERSRRDRFQLSKMTSYAKFLKDRFSMPFQNFLCCCLKLNHSKRLTLSELLDHTFLRNQTYKDTKTVHISLSDLLLINIDWRQDLLQSVQEDQCERLITHILHVLSDCSKDRIVNLVIDGKDKILGIGKLIGFDFPGMGERLYQAIVDLSHPHKDFNTSI